jgi:recombinational DNA repair protein (RecF pathway)
MKGFIIKLQRAKDEDMIVTILNQERVAKYYRFYGARHSILQMGYLIDYEEEQEKANFLPRLRSVSHIGFPWLYDRERLMLWHQFISIFDRHFRDVESIDDFYFERLLRSASRWEKQSPKRLIIETFVSILKYEGRLQIPNHCVICNTKIEDECAFLKGFLPTHPHCSKEAGVRKEKILELFNELSTINLDDKEVEQLHLIALKGF